MHKIFCDETWTTSYAKVKCPYIVFYGLMIDEENEEKILQEIIDFKQSRGLYITNKPVEIKWVKVEEEWKNANKVNRLSRYDEFLDIFFTYLKMGIISFGYMFLKKEEYDRVEKEFELSHRGDCHDYFFMLTFQFLYHCFVRSQIKNKPCKIFIDNRDMGAPGREYDISKLREIINKRAYKDRSPRGQLYLNNVLKRQLSNSVRIVNMADSKQEPLIQLADLCAGCVRYILENAISPPHWEKQLSLFDCNIDKYAPTNGKDALALSFYRKLRLIRSYKDVNLLKISRHYRFNIFPFEFKIR